MTSKQRSQATTRALQLVLVVGSAALTLGMSECSSYTANKIPDATSASSVSGNGTSSIGGGKSCIDSTGNARRDAQSWSDQAEITRPMICENASAIARAFTVTTSFICTDGQVTKLGAVSALNPHAPLCSPNAGACTVDVESGMRLDGSTWITQTPGATSVSCEDGSALTQATSIAQPMICTNGAVISVGAAATTKTGLLVSCPASSLSASFENAAPDVGAKDTLNVTSVDVLGVTYSCSSLGRPFASGTLAEGQQSVSLAIRADSSCDLTATTMSGHTLTAHVDVAPDCGKQFKVGGMCRDFSCLTVVEIPAPVNGGSVDIPARTSDGICYSMKLMGGIAFSDSSLNALHDHTVRSRHHFGSDHDPAQEWNPYLMGEKTVNFTMLGNQRMVKLAGGADSTSPILVDNFVLVGIYPTTAANPQSPAFYKAYGTADSALYSSVGNVLLNDQNVPLETFGANGTSTIAALDVTTRIQAGAPYAIDVRAEDCGGARQLSDIYLLFQ